MVLGQIGTVYVRRRLFLVKKESCVFIVRFEHAFLASGFNMRFEQALTFKTFFSHQ
jgi:hypothetical protein